jgi:hypothetical protein
LQLHTQQYDTVIPPVESRAAAVERQEADRRVRWALTEEPVQQVLIMSPAFRTMSRWREQCFYLINAKHHITQS